MAASSSTYKLQEIEKKENKLIEAKSVLFSDAFTPYLLPPIPELKYELLYGKESLIVECEMLPPNPEFKNQFERLVKSLSQLASENKLLPLAISILDGFPNRVFSEAITGGQNKYYFKHLKQMLEEIWCNLHDRCLHFKNSKPEDQNRKNIIEAYDFGLTTLTELALSLNVCGPGIKCHVAKALSDLTHSSSIIAWLALGRTSIIQTYQTLYPKLYYQTTGRVISAGAETHILAGLMRYAFRQKWEPYYPSEETYDPFIETVGLDEDYPKEEINRDSKVIAAKKRLESFGKFFLKSYENLFLKIIQQGFVKAYVSKFPLAESNTTTGADNWIDSEEISNLLHFFKMIGFDDPHQVGYAFEYSDDLMKMRYSYNLFKTALLHFLYNKERFLNVRATTATLSSKSYDFHCYNNLYKYAWLVDKKAAEINEACCIPVAKVSPVVLAKFLNDLPLTAVINFLEKIASHQFISLEENAWKIVQSEMNDVLKEIFIRHSLTKHFCKALVDSILENPLVWENIDLSELSATTKINLIVYSIKNDLAGLLLVLTANQDINLPLDPISNVLSLAIWHNKTDLLKIILSARKDCNLNVFNEVFLSPLIYAVRGGNLDVIQILSEFEYDAKAQGQPTLLMTAVKERDEKIVRFLCGLKTCLIDAMDEQRDTALSLAILRNDIAIVKALCEQKNCNINLGLKLNNITPLMLAAKSGNLEIIRILCQREDCLVNAVNQNGSTALIYAACEGHLDAVRFLTDRKDCEVDIINKEGYNALMFAVHTRNISLIEWLCRLTHFKINAALSLAYRLFFDAGFNIISRHPELKINEVDQKTNLTPLMMAANQSDGIFRSLSERKDCDINVANGDGLTVLMYELKKHQVETPILKLILEHPACDLSLKNKAGETALDLAEFKLCEIRTRMDNKFNTSLTTTDQASETAQLKIVNTIKNALDRQIIKAIDNNLPERVRALTAILKEKNRFLSDTKDTPLSYAVRKNKPDVIKVLLRTKKYDVDMYYNSMHRPYVLLSILNLAIVSGCVEALEELLKDSISKKDILRNHFLIFLKINNLEEAAYLKYRKHFWLLDTYFSLLCFIEKYGEKKLALTKVLINDDSFIILDREFYSNTWLGTIAEFQKRMNESEKNLVANFESRIIQTYRMHDLLTIDDMYMINKKQREYLENPIFTHLVAEKKLTPREIIHLSNEEVILFKVATITDFLLPKIQTNESKEPIQEEKISLEKTYLENVCFQLKPRLNKWANEEKSDPINLVDQWLTHVQTILNKTTELTADTSDELFKVLQPLHNQTLPVLHAIEKILDHFAPYSKNSFLFFSTSLQTDYLAIKKLINSSEKNKFKKVRNLLLSFHDKLVFRKEQHKADVIQQILTFYTYSPVIIVQLQRTLMKKEKAMVVGECKSMARF